MNKKLRTAISLILLLVGVPAAVYLCSLANRKYYLTSLLVIFLTLAAFFLRFEKRKPQARELVMIAVMCALAVAARAIFAAIPHFKPMMAIIMITGIAFGPEAGFLTGAMTGFVSNFLFGQGPWTPWQMFAYGIGGLLAGYFTRWGLLHQAPRGKCDLIVMPLFGFLTIVLVVGPLLDTCTLLTMSSTVSPAAAAAVYLSGLPVNAVHGIATLLTLLLVGKPLLEKLQRIQVKYGMMEL